MITVDEATQKILAVTPNGWGTEIVSLNQALGRVLAEDLKADRAFPPFDRVTMDGIALAYSAWEQGKRALPVEGIAAAGKPEAQLNQSEHCLEVMTGAMLPKGADTVIRYEDIKVVDGVAHIQISDLQKGQNVHRKGLDREAGTTLVPSGRLLGPAEIGVGATVGKSSLRVKAHPRVTLISTGDEIVAVNETPAPYQIRSSNSPTLESVFKGWGIPVKQVHLPDDLEATRQAVESIVSENDLIILSGAVSKGKYDYVPQALEGAGVEKIFHRIKQRPGKPLWFGRKKNGPTVFGLPGNPVSTFISCLRYVQPWLRKSLGLEPYTYLYASLAAPFSFNPELTYFLQVRTALDTQGRLWAHPVKGNGSGDHANLADVNGFLELPLEQIQFKEGELFPLILFRELI